MDGAELAKVLREEFMTASEAAHALGVDRMTITRKIRDGVLEAVNINPGGNSVWRVRSRSVKKLLGIEEETPVGG